MLAKNILILFCLVAFGFAVDVYGAILTVTTLADTDDDTCNSHCSLREAIKVSSSDDTIIFARELRGGTIELQKTLIIEGKNLTIDGPNRRRITLKGNSTFRILRVRTIGQTIAIVSIDSLIIRDGAEPGGFGGGVYVDPTAHLTLLNCLITNNHAAFGGGIRVYVGYLVLINSTVANNKSDGPFGAAGIDAESSLAVHLFNSTITRNISLDGTGGVMVYFGQPLLINSTVTDNISHGSGLGRVGGLSSYYDGHLGGLYNSIVARNIGETPDLAGFPGAAAHSLIGVGDSTGNTDGKYGNIVGTAINPADPGLCPLTDNGGGLPTYYPLDDSRAINAGNNAFLDFDILAPIRQYLTVDQRGFERIANKTIDMGAVEYGSSPVDTRTTITGRVTNNIGRGIAGSRIIVRDVGGETKIVVTNAFGYYRFVGLPVDSAYTVECSHKRFAFSSRKLVTEENLEYLDFAAQ